MNFEPGTRLDTDAFTAAVETLRGTLRGEALREGDDGYDAARAVWNAMIDRRPLLIVRAKGVADVIDAVGFARDHALPVSIRGGAHNVAGHAVCDGGLMIDLSCMRAVHVDPVARRARVEGGCTWGDLDRESQVFGLATPGGLISDTGIAGLTLAGGIGWLRSRHGLCIDNLVSADVVTADGKLVTASAESNQDLYWALRGGGGNFGVVVSFEFALHAVGPTVMFAGPIYPLSAGPGPIRFWRDFLADKHGDVGSLVEFSTIPESEDFPEAYWGQRCYTIAALYAGDADEGERLLQPLAEQADLVTDFSGQMQYFEVQSLFDTTEDASDETYLSLRDDAWNAGLRAFAERLWSVFAPFSEPNFTEELARAFPQRFSTRTHCERLQGPYLRAVPAGSRSHRYRPVES